MPLPDPGHSHLPLCPDYEGDSPKGEPLELRFPVKTDIVMDKPPALAVGCMTVNGMAAWHKKCYDEATEKERNDTTPSEQDPDQSWGKPREEFIY